MNFMLYGGKSTERLTPTLPSETVVPYQGEDVTVHHDLTVRIPEDGTVTVGTANANAAHVFCHRATDGKTVFRLFAPIQLAQQEPLDLLDASVYDRLTGFLEKDHGPTPTVFLHTQEWLMTYWFSADKRAARVDIVNDTYWYTGEWLGDATDAVQAVTAWLAGIDRAEEEARRVDAGRFVAPTYNEGRTAVIDGRFAVAVPDRMLACTDKLPAPLTAALVPADFKDGFLFYKQASMGIGLTYPQGNHCWWDHGPQMQIAILHDNFGINRSGIVLQLPELVVAVQAHDAGKDRNGAFRSFAYYVFLTDCFYQGFLYFNGTIGDAAARKHAREWLSRIRPVYESPFLIEDGTLIRYQGFDTHVTIPDEVVAIGSRAFFGHPTLEAVTLPPQLQHIDSCAFEGCKHLTEMDIPPSLRKIGGGVFENCTALRRVTFRSAYAGIRLTHGIFRNCTALEDIVLPQKLARIGSNTFENCKSLRTIDIPDTVKEISDEAFLNCAALETVRLPKNLHHIASSAFTNCPSLENRDGWFFRYNGTDSVIFIPKGVHTVLSHAFSDLDCVTHIHCPATLTTIRYSAFCNCSALETITLSAYTKSFDPAVIEKCPMLSLVEVNTDIPAVEAEVLARLFDALDDKTLFAYLSRRPLRDRPLHASEKTLLDKHVVAVLKIAIEQEDAACVKAVLAAAKPLTVKQREKLCTLCRLHPSLSKYFI